MISLKLVTLSLGLSLGLACSGSEAKESLNMVTSPTYGVAILEPGEALDMTCVLVGTKDPIFVWWVRRNQREGPLLFHSREQNRPKKY